MCGGPPLPCPVAVAPDPKPRADPNLGGTPAAHSAGDFFLVLPSRQASCSHCVERTSCYVGGLTTPWLVPGGDSAPKGGAVWGVQGSRTSELFSGAGHGLMTLAGWVTRSGDTEGHQPYLSTASQQTPGR